jgi:hypothetical protein
MAPLTDSSWDARNIGRNGREFRDRDSVARIQVTVNALLVSANTIGNFGIT